MIGAKYFTAPLTFSMTQYRGQPSYLARISSIILNASESKSVDGLHPNLLTEGHDAGREDLLNSWHGGEANTTA